jgi:hypothetical protein
MKCSNLDQPAGVAWCQLYCCKTAESIRVPITVLKEVEYDVSRNSIARSKIKENCYSSVLFRDEAAEITNCRKCLSMTEAVSKRHVDLDLPSK